ncbi:MAG: hypothetical protein AAGD06_03650 [Acidobacteriota bacterium]
MPTEVTKITLEGSKRKYVEFQRTVQEAHVAIAGFANELPKSLKLKVQTKDCLVEVWAKGLGPSSTLSVLVIASVAETVDSWPLHTITVCWNRGNLKVYPENCELGSPGNLVWQPGGGENECNIIGVLGLGGRSFGPTTARKSATNRLRWFCADLFRDKKRTSHPYAVLAEKGGEVRFCDPKITNVPAGPMLNPEGPRKM